MSSAPVAYELPARATQDDCRALYEFLHSNQSAQNLQVNGSRVERVSVLMLQILISTQKHFETAGQELLLLAPSNNLRDSLTLIGIPADYFEKGKPS